MQAKCRIKGGFLGSVGNKFHTDKKPPPTNITDKRMLAKGRLQCLYKPVAHHGGTAWQASFDDFAENSMGGSTGNRVGKIGMPMLKKAASGGNRIIDVLAA